MDLDQLLIFYSDVIDKSINQLSETGKLKRVAETCADFVADFYLRLVARGVPENVIVAIMGRASDSLARKG